MTSICFVMDPLSSLHLKTDSTLAILLAAKRRKLDVWIVDQRAISLINGEVSAHMYPLKHLDFSALSHDVRWYELGKAEQRPLAKLDVIMMRKDPPFDMNYIYTTYLLERVEAKGALVVNKPQSLRDCNEKVFATAFPECTPPLLISADAHRIRDFYQQQGDIILKPLDGMGGQSIFRLKPEDHNFNVVVETLTQRGQQPVMAQLYLPAVRQGDKRILLIDGEPVPHALARVPLANEYRANMAVGGVPHAQDLSERDVFITQAVGPELKKRGLFFVGLDVIGDYLTEVNVTCPTGIRALDEQCHIDIGGQLIEKLIPR